jgi:aldose 1-epimerase
MKLYPTLLLGACLLLPPAAAQAKIEKSAWGETADHRKVDLYTLRNAHGLSAGISTFGGTIVTLEVPDRYGKFADIVRGFDTLDGYTAPANAAYYYGAIIGRFANVIKDAQFTLDGKTYHLAANSGANNLHGGPIGFNKRVWSAAALDGSSPSLVLRYVSPDGESNFPGTLDVTVTYTLTADDSLRMDYRASTDKPTVVNLTNHSYFNLKGHAGGDVLSHRLQIMADTVTLRDPTGAPDGKTEAVKGTGFDFRTPTDIGAHIGDSDPQIAAGPGFNQNYILQGKAGTLRLAARVVEPQTGRVLEMLTTQPGVQLFTANFPVTISGKGGARYAAHGAFCLETQHYPNSPNIAGFPSTTLRPGEQFHEVTVFRFWTMRHGS